jgi:hypothetical protein
VRKVVYILLIAFIGLGIIFFTHEKDIMFSEYSVNLNPGFDLSKLNNAKTSYTPQIRTNKVSNSLIKYNINSHYSNNISSSIPSLSNNTLYNSSSAAYSYNNTRNIGTNNTAGGSGTGGQISMLYKSSSSSSAASSVSTTSMNGFLSNNNSVFADNNRLSAPVNPLLDYKEGDITHPGGNPTTNPIESVPIGDGMFIMLILGFAYSIFLFIRRL